MIYSQKNIYDLQTKHWTESHISVHFVQSIDIRDVSRMLRMIPSVGISMVQSTAEQGPVAPTIFIYQENIVQNLMFLIEKTNIFSSLLSPSFHLQVFLRSVILSMTWNVGIVINKFSHNVLCVFNTYESNELGHSWT